MNSHTDCKPTLYYDGQCPLCSAEIRRLSTLGDGSLRVQDIHGLENTDTLPDRKTLLRTLHLKQTDGQFVTGLEANVAAWQYTRLGFLFRWLLWWPFRPVAQWCYATWADIRFRKRYGD